jgi:hypothetical protein
LTFKTTPSARVVFCPVKGPKLCCKQPSKPAQVGCCCNCVLLQGLAPAAAELHTASLARLLLPVCPKLPSLTLRALCL